MNEWCCSPCAAVCSAMPMPSLIECGGIFFHSALGLACGLKYGLTEFFVCMSAELFLYILCKGSVFTKEEEREDVARCCSCCAFFATSVVAGGATAVAAAVAVT